MRLRVTTPLALVVEHPDVRHVRAEDATGAFGLRARHAPLITMLATSVVAWLDGQGVERYVAVRGGVLFARDDVVDIATRDAVSGEDLARLEHDVIERFRREEHLEETARGGAARLESTVIRRIYEYVHGEKTHLTMPGAEDGDEQR